MKRILLSVAVGALLLSGTVVMAEEPALDTDEKKTIYTLGLAIARNLANFNLSEEELAVVKLGLTDGVMGNDLKVEPQRLGPLHQLS